MQFRRRYLLIPIHQRGAFKNNMLFKTLKEGSDAG